MESHVALVEPYTSKASFLDGDEIPCKYDGMEHVFSDKRLKRGLYKSKEGFCTINR
jgi:putative transposase